MEEVKRFIDIEVILVSLMRRSKKKKKRSKNIFEFAEVKKMIYL